MVVLRSRKIGQSPQIDVDDRRPARCGVQVRQREYAGDLGHPIRGPQPYVVPRDGAYRRAGAVTVVRVGAVRGFILTDGRSAGTQSSRVGGGHTGSITAQEITVDFAVQGGLDHSDELDGVTIVEYPVSVGVIGIATDGLPLVGDAEVY